MANLTTLVAYFKTPVNDQSDAPEDPALKNTTTRRNCELSVHAGSCGAVCCLLAIIIIVRRAS